MAKRQNQKSQPSIRPRINTPVVTKPKTVKKNKGEGAKKITRDGKR